MASKSTIDVKILGDNKGLSKALGDSEGKISKFAKVGVAAVAGLAVAAGAAAVGIGAGLFKIGSDFDEQFDKIRVGTGATGDALVGLEDSFKKVLSTVPASFEDAGSAIADLNTRLGLTGAPLEKLAGQFINLSRITGTDVATNIDLVTRTFGDWGIAAGDQEGALDKLYRASQASGIGFEELSTSTTKYGASLRNLGFGFDESTALLAVFNKTGVNTETVFAGLKAGVGKLAKSGEDVPATFARIVDEITAMGPGTEATGLAIELFGQRAGPDLADAIAGGKFEIDDMLAAITDGSDTINAAADDTADFSEKWLLFKNKVLVGLEPIATKVFNAVGDAMDKLGPKAEVFIAIAAVEIPKAIAKVKPVVEKVMAAVMAAATSVVDFFRNNWDSVSGAISGAFSWLMNNKDVVVSALAGIGAGIIAYKTILLVQAIPATQAWVVANLALAASWVAAHLPIIAAAAAIGLLVAGVVWAYQNVDWFREAVDKVWQVIQTGFNVALRVAKVVIDAMWGAISTAASWLQTAWDKTEKVRSLMAGGFKTAVTDAKTGFDLFKSATERVVSWLQTAWNKSDTLRSLMANGFKLAIDLTKTAFDGVKIAIEKTAEWLQTAWNKSDTLRSLLAGAFKVAVDGSKSSFNNMKAALERVAEWLQTAWSKSDTLRRLFAGGFRSAVDGVKGAFNSAKSAVQGVGNAIQWVIDKANRAIDVVSRIPSIGGGGGFNVPGYTKDKQ